MAVNTIGPPIDRPIIPPRRPDRIGDFSFTPGRADDPAKPAAAVEADEDPEAQTIRRGFLDLLSEQLPRR